MKSATWRGWQWWRSDDEDATFDDVSIDSADPAVDELLTALTAQARPHEVEGLAEPLAAYRATVAGRRKLVPTAASSGLVLTGLLGTKAAAAAGGVALGLAATAMAVAVNLPDTGADRTPAPAAASSSSAQPSTDAKGVGPDAKGPAAHGLCTAWSNHRKNGDTAAMDSVPMRNLATAAGGEGKIAAYCAAVPDPGTKSKTPKPGKTKPTTGQGKQDKARDTGEGGAPGTTRKPTAKPTKTTTSSSRTAPSPSSGARAATPRKGS